MKTQWVTDSRRYTYESENYRMLLLPLSAAGVHTVLLDQKYKDEWVWCGKKVVTPLQAEIILVMGPLAFLRKWLGEIRRGEEVY